MTTNSEAAAARLEAAVHTMETALRAATSAVLGAEFDRHMADFAAAKRAAEAALTEIKQENKA